MKHIAKYILNQVAANQLSHEEAKILLLELQNQESIAGAEVAGDGPQEMAEAASPEIAIIGMAGRFPKAANLRDYWLNLTRGVNCIDHYPENRKKEYLDQCAKSAFTRILTDFAPEDVNFIADELYVKGGYLNEVDKFDAAFFRIPPKEAIFMDPLQRVFLETVYEAMEDAGYGGKKLYGVKAGVFAGKDHTAPTMYRYMTEPDPMHFTGSWTGILASRVSYIFNFQGPSMVIDTACSSGLVAIHEACRALANQECVLAIAGGIHFQLFPIKKGSNLIMNMVESNDGYVNTFDKDAHGTVWGEGAGAVILKPLSMALADRDHIYAVIKGSAINNDGASSGITAPNAEAQKDVIIRAWKQARINPETVSYIEAHGTGTNLGDPIEVKGITAAFEEFTAKKQFCGIGSVKTNVGHMVAASGLASLMKVVLALKNNLIPPSINFKTPNPYINFTNSPVYMQDHTHAWKPGDGIPRRAGVSAFGFSGTNCHVVLEEAPGKDKEQILPPANQWGILTFSARSKGALRELVNCYHEYLGRNPTLDLESLCYTANTGRGHYGFRIAVVAATIAELTEKIAKLTAGGWENLQEPGTYYGFHKLIADHKTAPGENELTETERRQLSAGADQTLKELIAVPAPVAQDSMDTLCRAYTRGADIDWEQLYRARPVAKISVPAYPLERIKCWAAPNTTGIEGLETISNPVHPLLQKVLAESLHEKIFLTRFNINTHWVLSEHRALDTYLAPGTIYLEMARAASEAFYPQGPIELRDLLFTHPIVVEQGETVEVQTIIKQGPEYLDFIVASKTVNSFEEEEWVIHAQGKVYQVAPGEIRRADLAELSNKLEIEQNKIRLEQDTETENFQLGPRWNNIIFGAARIGAGTAGGAEALLQFQLPEDFKDDLQEYQIHPALMDHAVNAFSQSIEGMCLPLMYKKMTIYQRMPARFYSYIRRKDRSPESLETITLDATLIDEDGNVLIEVEDYSLKKVRPSELQFKKSGLENLYYRFGWIRAGKVEAPASIIRDGVILVFKDESGIAAELIERYRAKGRNPVAVEMGPRYRRISETSFQITGAEQEYSKLLEEFSGSKITQVLHLWAISNNAAPEESLAELEVRQNRGVQSMFYLARAMASHNYPEPVDLVLVADYVHEITGDEAVLNPAAASLFGLGKAAAAENARLKCRALDIDRETDPGSIFAEIQGIGSGYLVAFRRNQRWVEEFQRLKLPQEPAPAIKEGGVYLITGGTGGVGLEIGKHLAKKARVKLALINRTPTPDPGLWDGILARSEDHRLEAKIKAIREMEKAGAEVGLFEGDVSSETSLRSVLKSLRHKFGKINGIIHAAGVAGAGFMINKDFQTFQKVMAPKVQGTWLLDKLTAADDLDFFVMFSSIVTMTGGVGQSDYTAANSYLDAFASARSRRGKKTITINWPLWEGVGMADLYQATDEDLIFKALSPAKAVAGFEEILNSGFRRVIPGELNYQLISSVQGELPFCISDQISATLARQKARITPRKGGAQPGRIRPKVTVYGIGNWDPEGTAYIVAQIWAQVLGLTEIDSDQNFYDLGGDSILASELFKELDEEYPETLSISDIFSNSTVIGLAKLIDQKGGSSRRKAVKAAPDMENEKTRGREDEGLKETTVIRKELDKEISSPEADGEPGIVVSAAATGEHQESPGLISEPSERTGDAQAPHPALIGINDRWPEVKMYQRDEPEAKELTIKLQREITTSLHRCLPLQVILTDEKLRPWYYEHFINIFAHTQNNEHLYLDFLEEWAPYRAVINEISLGSKYMARYQDIIPFIIDNLNRGNYLNVCADEYYLPRRLRSQMTHFVHQMLIYGYDNQKQELKTIGFNANNIIDQVVYTYDEFRAAYEKGKEYYQQSAPWTSRNAVQLFYFNGFDRKYPFNIHKFLRKLYNYLHSVKEESVIYFWALKEEPVVYGFQVYEILIEYLEKILAGQYLVDYRATHLLYEHKQAIAIRLEYIMARYGLTGRISELYQAYLEIVNLFKTIRLTFFDLESKSNYLNLGREEIEELMIQLRQVIEEIKTGKEIEKSVLTEIYNLLREQFPEGDGNPCVWTHED